MFFLEVWIRYVMGIWARAYRSIFMKHKRLNQSVQHIPGKFCRRHPMQLWKMSCIQICPTQMSIIMETFFPIYSCWTNSAAALCIHCRPPHIEQLTLQDQSLGEEFLNHGGVCVVTRVFSPPRLSRKLSSASRILPWLQVTGYQLDHLL